MAFYLWPEISLKVLWIAGVIIGGIILILGLILLGSYLYDRDPERTKTLAKWLTSPLWIIPVAIFYGAVWLFERHERRLRAFGEFTKPFIGPSAALALLAVIAYGFYDNPVKTAILIGALISAAALLVGGVVLVERADEKKRYGSAVIKPKTRARRAYESVADTVKLGATYVATKKRGSRICPFLSFETR